jgi:tripartite-type tricarboxylate transporter receptor subunit TctC
MSRAVFWKALAAVAICASVLPGARAASFPDRPIKLVVPLAPGGGGDIIARLVAAKLTPILGQSVVVENRAGGATIIGTEYVAKSPPDGYTLVLATSSHLINSSVIKVPFDPVKDFSGVSLMATSPLVLTVNPNKLNAHNLAELVAAAKANPNGLTNASSGIGSLPHLSGELLARSANVKLVHVPYKGSGPAESDLLGGQVDMYFGSPSSLLPQVKRGALRMLASTGAKRSPTLPDVPTLSETYPGFSSETCYVVLAPAKTPKAVVQKLNSAINKVLADPALKKQISDLGADVVGGTPDEAIKYVDTQVRKWDKLVHEAGIRVE